jgi:ArsR family transcriptional regulator, arsenate/arsenite/antimonite-responsive transcriptional repressor
MRLHEYGPSLPGLDYICQGEYNGRMKDRRLATLDTVLKALADPTRLRIIGLLAAGEICVCHIHESLGVPQPKTSRHLAYLRRAGVVVGRKDGLWVHYRLAEMEPVVKAVVDAAAHALGHLETAERDRKRLAARISLPSSRLLPVVQSCCTPTS